MPPEPTASAPAPLVEDLEGLDGARQDGAPHPMPSTAERRLAGRRLRKTRSRGDLARLGERRRDPLDILGEQNAKRVPELVPIREERMAQSPFAFYRGAAAIMASDLAGEPHSGILVPSCGDAHLANFGFYASPQRTLVFDLNDFDEAAWAPWEWDVKRLVTSVVLSAQTAGREERSAREAAFATVEAYATALSSGTASSPLDRFYAHLDAEAGASRIPRSAREVLRTAVKQAKRRTGERAAQKLTVVDEHGGLRFIETPPTMVDLPPDLKKQQVHLLHRYLETAPTEIRQLMRHYAVSDSARRVVGVGSVGTVCTLTLLEDGDGNTLILQAKEADRSVLEQYGGIAQPRTLLDGVVEQGQGRRVVGLQRILQAVSDPFLGYLQADGVDLYVRQFHDMKGGIDAEAVDDEAFRVYAQACGVTLARAHCQSPLSAIISGYVGRGRSLAESMWEWSNAYADRTRDDFAAFTAGRAAASE